MDLRTPILPRPLLATLLLTGLCALVAAQSPPPALPVAARGSDAEARFEKSVRPLLIAQCVPCHGPTAPQGGLRLDTPEGARKALVPGDPTASRLIQAIRYDGALKMPPAGKLSAAEIQVLTTWVASGAAWPARSAAPATSTVHWSLVPPRRVAPPAPPGKPGAVDAFLIQKRRAAGIARSAPPADRRTLIRRASFDLTGLPPTPEEVDAFLKDAQPGAYERVVDRLLASPAYGERWARHWLDVARYADSNGLDENLAHGFAWRYRDWVVRSLNRDLPYDRFVTDQVAGDLVPEADPAERAERITATGFLTLGPKVLAEQDKPKLVMDIVDEQIDVLSKSVMGLTIACARCHDHKFDPISTKDYYALAGIFKSTKTMANLDFVSRWNERGLTSPTLEADQKRYDAETLAPLRAAAAAAHRASDDAVKAARGVFVEATSFVKGNVGKDNYGKGTINTLATPTYAEWEVDVPEGGKWELSLRYASAEKRPVRILANGAAALDGVGGRVTGTFAEDGQRWDGAGAVTLKPGRNTLRLECGGAIPHVTRLLLTPAGSPSPAATQDAVRAAEAALQAAEAKRPQPITVMAVDEGKVEDVRVHVRGDTQTLGDSVRRGFPAVLCGGTRTEVAPTDGSGRLALARWLTRPEHPLTARVAVNRVWQHLFGDGLVRTPDNWGLRGEKPTHPELLDWLATTFAREDGWSQKKLIRRIVLTDAYRQASLFADLAAVKADPDNRLLWRANRRRLEAEPLRDSLLAVAGTLDRTLGGNLLPTKDGDYVTNDQSGNAAQYGAPRRSLYLPVIRNAVFDYFQAFDFGDPSMVNARRAATTVAPQALYLLNSPMVRDQAQAFAQSLLQSPSDDTAKVVTAYRRAYQRAPFPAEIAQAQRFLARIDALLADRPEAARRQLAWSALCQTLLSSNEFLYVE